MNKFFSIFICLQFDLILGHYLPQNGSSLTRKINEEDSSDIDVILSGVKTVVRGGSVGFVLLSTSASFPILVGKQGATDYAPILAGGRYKKGRIIAGGHTGLLETSATPKGDNDQLLLNAINWLAQSTPSPVNGDLRTVGRYYMYGDDALMAKLLTQHSFKTAKVSKADIRTGSLSSTYDVILIGSSNEIYKDEVMTQNLLTFVQNGGGIFICNTGWAWDLQDIKLANKLTAPAGLIWSGRGSAGNTGGDNTFITSRDLLQNVHAGDMWTKIVRFLKSKSNDLPSDKIIGITKMIDGLIEFLPDDDATFSQNFRTDVSGLDLPAVIPSEKKPVTSLVDKVNLLVSYSLNAFLLKPEEVQRHPSADIFPGKILGESDQIQTKHTRHFNVTSRPMKMRTEFFTFDSSFSHCGHKKIVLSDDDVREVVGRGNGITIDPTVTDWHSTGLYAPAGQVISLNFQYGGSLNGFQVQIGSHTDDLRGLDKWERCPRITITKPVTSNDMTIASPFGGLIYIIVPSKASPGPMTISVSGSVEAPRYELDVTSAADWEKFKNFNGPWAEFESKDIILTVPTLNARDVKDPKALMTYWNEVMDNFAHFVDIPDNRPTPFRMVSDVQISAGYMHSGYPIMTDVPEAKTTVSVASLKSRDGWGQYHEVGHNHQEGAWTWGGLTEVTNNLMVLYIYDHYLKMDLNTIRENVTPLYRKQGAKAYIKNGKKFEDWKNDAWLALSSFMQLQKQFGWDFFTQIFKSYHKLSKSETSLSDDGLRDLWTVMASKQGGENLFPFYRSWGVPLSEAAEDKVKDLPLTKLSINDLLK